MKSKCSKKNCSNCEIYEKCEKNDCKENIFQYKEENIKFNDCKINNAKLKKIKRIIDKSSKHNVMQDKKSQAQKNIEQNETWYKLDNSANIYPAISNSFFNSIYRLSIVLDENVKPDILQEALNLTIDRFPFFKVHLKEGLFWFYFQGLSKKPTIEEEKEYPCRPLNLKKKKCLFRVLYHANKISFECFHALSDGYGGTTFLNMLLTTYYDLQGVTISDKDELGYNVYDKPTLEEGEDSFRRYVRKDKVKSRKENKSYAIKSELAPIDVLYMFNGNMNVNELKTVAKSYGATINQFLSAVYIKSMIDYKKRYTPNISKPVKLSIPVNIRKYLPSKSMRNFTLYINVEIPKEKENGTLQDFIEIIKTEMLRLDEDFVYGFIGKNVGSETNPLVRIFPLFIKKLALKIAYANVGEVLFTSTISNLGNIKLPAEVEKHVKSYQAIIGATKYNRFNLGVCSCGETLTCSISSRLQNHFIAQNFFSSLAKCGIKIELYSNI